MFSWTSLFPFELPTLGLPTFALPANIQRRFISFILRRSLGKFVRPGQLDDRQVDSQIGSGSIEISQIELADEGVNELLEGVPVRLRGGSIGKISAKIPWSNIWWAPLEVTIDELDIGLVLTAVSPAAAPAVDLTASVSNVAETFVHQELDPAENRALHDSILHTRDTEEVERRLPGGLDSFTSEGDDAENVDESMAAEEVSFLTSLTESLLSRLRITIRNTTVTIIHDKHAQLSIRIPDMHFGTEDTMEPPSEVSTESAPAKPARVAVTRTFRISSVSAQMGLLTPMFFGRREFFEESDESSSEDESAQMHMSQSIMSLKSSASMYHSAMSLPPIHTSAPSAVPGQRPLITVLSTKDPILVQIISHPIASYRSPSSQKPKVDIQATLGVIACGLESWHIRELLAFSHFIPPSPPPPPIPTISHPATIRDTLRASLQLRALVAILVQPNEPSAQSRGVDDFFAHPLLPYTETSHVRVQVDQIECLISKELNSDVSPPALVVESSASVHDIFMVYFRSTQSTSKPETLASRSGLDGSPGTLAPIFIFDPHIPTRPNGAQSTAYPFLDVTSEWERQGTMLKPSAWRVRPPPRRETAGASLANPAGAAERRDVITFRNASSTSELALLPIHVFADLNMISSFLVPFLDGMSPKPEVVDDDADSEGSEYAEPTHADDTVMETPRPRVMDLEPEVPLTVPRDAPTTRFVAHCAVIRLEVRPPPSVSHGRPIPSRSGTVIVDLYGLEVSSGSVPTAQSERGKSSGRHPAFALGKQPPPSARPARQEPGQLIAEVEWSDILVAFAAFGDTRAATHLTIGSLTSLGSTEDFEGNPDSSEVPLPPRFSVRKYSPSADTEPQVPLRPKLYIDCALPQLRVSIQKAPLDGLQLWADDLSQWADRIGTTAPSPGPDGEFGDENLIGSRFFARRAAKSLSSSTTTSSLTRSHASKEEGPVTETIVSLTITEVSAHLWVPRADSAVFESPVDRPLKVSASDLAVVLHSRPEGKNETVVDLAVVVVNITDTSAAQDDLPLLYLTRPRAMNSELIPMVKLRFASVVISDTAAKESRIKTNLHGFTFLLSAAHMGWANDLAAFIKAPPGAFETVVPSERTVLSLRVSDCSVQAQAPNHPGSLVLALNDIDFSTDIIGNSPELAMRLKVASTWLLAIDHLAAMSPHKPSARSRPVQASDYWSKSGFARLLEIRDLALQVKRNSSLRSIANQIDISHVDLFMSLCTDTMSAVSAFISDFSATLSPPAPPNPNQPRREGPVLRRDGDSHMLSSLDESAFSRPPEFGADADMIRDDLPTNTEYLDASFGAAAGFRDFDDDDLEDFGEPDDPRATYARKQDSLLNDGRETIRILDPLGVRPVEYYFDNLAPEDLAPRPETLVTSVRAHNCNATLSLHAGFEWQRIQSIVREEVDAMRRRLLRIRELVSTGKTPSENVEQAHTVLFNSVYIGLGPDADDLEGDALLAAIDEQLEDDADETASQGSWQTLDKMHIPPSTVTGAGARQQEAKPQAQRLARSKRSSIQFCFHGLEAEYDMYPSDSETASRILVMVKNVEILDHLRTSTWRTFLTQMRRDSKGNARETDSNMVRLELLNVRPVKGDPSEETRLRAKILPLRLHVDQDALDFIKKFFAFDDPDATPAPPTTPDPSKETFFQHVDIFPVELKLDYKPKRVDYRALKEGKTIELMNFFHFDGSEMTLRHIEMFGETGWGPMLEKLNDLWSPDVKAHQLAEVISGIEPIRSFVNVGSGVADLVLLPIAQYKKDGRIMRGVQKGATSFVKTTAIEAITLGARLANGTQIILEQAESLFSNSTGLSAGGQAELENSLMRWDSLDEYYDDEDDAREYGYGGEEGEDMMTMSVADLSRFAHQPTNLQEGLQSAYRSLGKNLGEAAQTILAVPIEVYERSGTEGPVRAVVRALPVAVLKPMIGATEAVSKTLLGLRGTLDPNVRYNVDEKYKR